MANKTPVKALFTGSDVTALGEFASGDTIAASVINGLDAISLPLAGGAMTGAITTNSTFDGVDIATRDAILTSTTTTAGAALPKAGGTMTGTIADFRSTGIDDNANALAITIDSDEVVGIGVVPETDLHTNWSNLQIGGNSIISGWTAQGADSGLSIKNNAKLTPSGLTKYISTDEAAMYELDQGKHNFFVAPSGSAAATITFTKAMVIFNDGGVRAAGKTDTDTSNTGSITLNFANNQNFVLTLTGNVTLANPTTETVGQSGFIAFIQDGTGSRTVSLGTDYETAAAAGLTLTATASATDLVPYLVVASNRILLGTPQLAFA